MQPLFSYGLGINDPILTIRQTVQFLEIRSNSVRFSIFRSTEKEISHAVFTTTRSQATKRLSALEVFMIHSRTRETGQKSKVFDL